MFAEERDPSVDWAQMEEELNAERTILWRGKQWCVTEHGLETIAWPYHYDIDRRALTGLHEGVGGPYSAVLEQLGDKSWIDLEDLIAAFQVALETHQLECTPLPPGCLEMTIGAERSRRGMRLIAELQL